jgi:glycosyltransferase involved in cell wall biosynthesis
VSVRVSVVLPTFNRREVLARAIRSAPSRIGPDDEIIVVDDGSTDGTGEFLESQEPPVRVLRTENRGPSAARNAGIGISRGRFIAFLDSDDEWTAGSLDPQVTALAADDELGLSYANVDYEDLEGRPVATKPSRPQDGHALRPLLFRNFVTTSTAVVPRAVLDEVGLFDENLDHSMDWDLWLRIAERYRFHYHPETVALYRFHPGQQIRHREEVDDCRSRILANRLAHYERHRPELVPYVRRLLAYRLLRLGRLLARAGNLEGARNRFREAVRIRPLAAVTAWRYRLTSPA